jgi:hypothetical protein
MTINVDTLLVALYTIVDDEYKVLAASCRSHVPGARPVVSDSEVITLMILAQCHGRSETAFLVFVRRYWHQYFPRVLHQSAFNRRARGLVGVLAHLITQVAVRLQAYLALYEAIDCVPVPLMSRCRGLRHRLFGSEASLGKGGSDQEWYYGMKLLLSVTDDGIVTGFVLGPAGTQDRWLAEHFLCWRTDPSREPWQARDLPPNHRKGGRYLGPTGRIIGRNSAGTARHVLYLADRGFTGEVWGQHWQWDYESIVITREDYRQPTARAERREHSSWRQVVETVNDHLVEDFNLKLLGARTLWGVVTRVAAKLLAVNIGLELNRLWERADFAFATLFSC